MLTRNRMQHLVRRTHPPGDQETAPRGQDQRHPHGLFPLRLDQGDGSRGTGNHSPPSHTQHMVLSQRKYSIYSIMKCLIDDSSPAYLPPDQLDTQISRLLSLIASLLAGGQSQCGLPVQVADILGWKRLMQVLYCFVDAAYQHLATPAIAASYRSSSPRDTPIDTSPIQS